MHVLNNKICSAEVNKSFHLFSICKVESLQHVPKFLFAVVFVEHVSILCNDFVSLFELVLAILTYHVLLELPELASRNVDQLIIGRLRGTL